MLPPAILGPEMAAPSSWAPGIVWFFPLENLNAHKVPFLGGVGYWIFLGGGGERSTNFIFYVGARIFLGKSVKISLWFSLNLCEFWFSLKPLRNPRPCTGSKIQNQEKRVSESKKPCFPSLQKRAFRVKKIPILSVVPCREMGIFGLKPPFSWVVRKGDFSTLKPFFPHLQGFLTPVQGRGVRKGFLCLEGGLCPLRSIPLSKP